MTVHGPSWAQVHIRFLEAAEQPLKKLAVLAFLLNPGLKPESQKGTVAKQHIKHGSSTSQPVRPTPFWLQRTFRHVRRRQQRAR